MERPYLPSGINLQKWDAPDVLHKNWQSGDRISSRLFL
jgi:hypothetical protein